MRQPRKLRLTCAAFALLGSRLCGGVWRHPLRFEGAERQRTRAQRERVHRGMLACGKSHSPRSPSAGEGKERQSRVFESGVPMSKRRVVVTGMGIVSPVGNDVATAWKNVVAGASGIGPITHFDASAFPTRIAGEVKDFDPAQFIPAKDIKKMDTFIHYGVAAGAEALRDSGLE